MSKKRNKNWKLRIIMILAFIGAAFFFIKTKTSWLDGDQETKKPKKKHEAYYITKLANELGGEEEVRVEGGRVDIVTKDHAIEVEWASKWKGAIGQAIWYGLQTKKAPKVILLIKDRKKEYKYFMMLNSALKHAKIDMETEIEYIE